MGMDVMGKAASTEEGKYFRNNVWWWRPLWDYCERVAPKLTKKVKYAQTNDGDGLDTENSLALAAVLRAKIEEGHTAAYEVAYEKWRKSLPQLTCNICGGTGRRAEPPIAGPGDYPCNGCGGDRQFDLPGTGLKQHPDSHYPFSEENVMEFATFLEGCGGFEIW